MEPLDRREGMVDRVGEKGMLERDVRGKPRQGRTEPRGQNNYERGRGRALASEMGEPHPASAFRCS